MPDKIEQDGYLTLTFHDDTELVFGFKDIKGWHLWGSWIVIKYVDHRIMYPSDTITAVEVVYNSDEVAKALSEQYTEDDDAVATPYSCVSCHEKIQRLH